ncbi:MAG: Glucitol operon repressor [Actinobacteria bacterium ADurb.Bin346]|nr:MAG: Glucitol operon repressor [Actinobacteria bacterium ADurb.Bin346]
MYPEDRRAKILNYINSRDFTDVPQIAEKFKVSEITARRDLLILTKSGLINRVYGGVKSSPPASAAEPVFTEHLKEFKEQKQQIAKEAIKYINDGDTVFLDSGSTLLELARLLPQKKNLKVITWGLHILDMLCDLARKGDFDGEILCCGGTWRKDPDLFIGPQSIRFFDDIIINKAFLGIIAVSLDFGWMGSSLIEVEATKKIMSISEKVIGLAVSGNFSKTAIARIGTLKSLPVVITDSGIDKRTIKQYKGKGLNIIIAAQ